MNLLYGTKHAGYNWQPNHCADFAQPVGAPCLQMMLTTLSVSVWVVLVFNAFEPFLETKN
jgi:hypothetical protein